MRAEDVEGKRVTGQHAEKRLLESREVNDGGRRLTGQPRGVVGQLPPGHVCIDAVQSHPLGDAGEASHGGRDVLAVRQSNQPRGCSRWRRSGARPPDFEEVPVRRCGGGLAVDDQHFQLRERL
jgi:hypothetical protein